MARVDILNSIYSKHKSSLEFQFDSLIAPPLISLLSPMDVFNLNKIATSVKYSGNINKKYKDMDEIMRNRGFRRFHAGTNRLVYTHDEFNKFVVKVAVDRIGLGDNPDEFRNQHLLKPFVTKVFEVTPCGTVGIFERVDPITSREEFQSIGGDIFDILTQCIIGKYILEDIGCKYFMNYGIRKGFGPVLLDFPYVYELDGNKIFCNRPLYEGIKFPVCDGEIDYDTGFNNLVCTKCGKHYIAKELESKINTKMILLKGGRSRMKTRLIHIENGVETIINESNTETAIIEKPKQKAKKKSGELVTKLVHIPIEDIYKGNSVKMTFQQEEKPVDKKETSKNNSIPEKEKEPIKETKVPTEVKPNEGKTTNFLENTRTKDEDEVVKTEENMGILNTINQNVVDKAMEDFKNQPDLSEPVDDGNINIQSIHIDDSSIDDEEDDLPEFDEYISNRQRKQMKSNTSAKKSNRKSPDLEGF